VGGTLVSGTTHNKCKKYCTIHNTDTVAYATHSDSYSTERKKKVHRLHTGTQQLQWYTTFTAVHELERYLTKGGGPKNKGNGTAT